MGENLLPASEPFIFLHLAISSLILFSQHFSKVISTFYQPEFSDPSASLVPHLIISVLIFTYKRAQACSCWLSSASSVVIISSGFVCCCSMWPLHKHIIWSLLVCSELCFSYLTGRSNHLCFEYRCIQEMFCLLSNSSQFFLVHFSNSLLEYFHLERDIWVRGMRLVTWSFPQQLKAINKKMHILCWFFY